MGVEAFGQSKKKAPIDLLGPIVGYSTLIDNGDKGGDGTFQSLSNIKRPLTPSIGFSYHRYMKRWSHIFQTRYASSKLLYDEVRSHYVYASGESILYQTETGPTTIKYSSLNLVYMLGYCVNKPAGIYIYIGEQIGKTTIDKSNRDVDIVAFGKYFYSSSDVITYTPYPEPVLSHSTIPEESAYEFTSEILGRVETRIKLSDKLLLIPSIESGYEVRTPYLHYRFRIAGFIDLGYTL